MLFCQYYVTYPIKAYIKQKTPWPGVTSVHTNLSKIGC
jgi:hypothetical protein